MLTRVYLAFILAFLLPNQIFAATSTRFVDKEKAFSIQLPKGWEVKKNTMGAEVIALRPKSGRNDSFRENVNVVVENLNQKLAPKEYFKASQTVLQKVFNEFKIEKTGHTTIDRHDTYWCVFTHKMGGIHAKVLQYMTTEGSKGYVITGSAMPETFNKFKKAFEETSKSFKLEAPKEVVKK